jgi:LysM repeat protein
MNPQASSDSTDQAAAHTVRSGDDLASIAATNGLTTDQLQSFNPQISDPALIVPGQIINLSAPATVASSNNGGALGMAYSSDFGAAVVTQTPVVSAAVNRSDNSVASTDLSQLGTSSASGVASGLLGNTGTTGTSSGTVGTGASLGTSSGVGTFSGTSSGTSSSLGTISGSGSAATSGSGSASGTQSAASTVSTTYTVKPGDTLSGIASANNVSLSQLESFNPQITNAGLIKPGETINLSGGAASGTSSSVNLGTGSSVSGTSNTSGTSSSTSSSGTGSTTTGTNSSTSGTGSAALSSTSGTSSTTGTASVTTGSTTGTSSGTGSTNTGTGTTGTGSTSGTGSTNGTGSGTGSTTGTGSTSGTSSSAPTNTASSTESTWVVRQGDQTLGDWVNKNKLSLTDVLGANPTMTANTTVSEYEKINVPNTAKTDFVGTSQYKDIVPTVTAVAIQTPTGGASTPVQPPADPANSGDKKKKKKK